MHSNAHDYRSGTGWSPTTLTSTSFFAMLFLFLTLTAGPARAQTYGVLHNFTSGSDGAFAESLVMDRAGNLYGTTRAGGASSHGTVFKSSRGTLVPLYSFTRTGSGTFQFPWHSLTIGPDGTLYGTDKYGGTFFGTIFNLRPPATPCKTALCPWTQTVLYTFSGSDGADPTGNLSFGPAGEIYGGTLFGGSGANCNPSPCGVVFKLTPVQGNWTESIIHNFTGDDGAYPSSGVTFDAQGNLYGTAVGGGVNAGGVVFELKPSGNGWNYQAIHSFLYSDNGGEDPYGNLLLDPSGNLYAGTGQGGSGGGGIFQLAPSGGGWNFNVLYSFSGTLQEFDYVYLARDNSGNLYGTTFDLGAYGYGSVFRLSPGSGGWTYTPLYDFCRNGPPCSDGANPGSIVVDSAGNLYGTANTGGAYGVGVLWEITP